MPILPRFEEILESGKLVKELPGNSRFFFACKRSALNSAWTFAVAAFLELRRSALVGAVGAVTPAPRSTGAVTPAPRAAASPPVWVSLVDPRVTCSGTFWELLDSTTPSVPPASAFTPATVPPASTLALAKFGGAAVDTASYVLSPLGGAITSGEAVGGVDPLPSVKAV